ncbi:MAG: DNA replication and repair protein RecF [Actinomycetia bacterium]|nr:DNA replication and repair protein RecF [Actinomycetes bacterium]
MQITRLWLNDVRSYHDLDLDLHAGLTAIIGPNGIGKTNILEALGLLATLKSFRGAPVDSVIRRGAEKGFVRAEGIRDEREVLIELELAKGKTRAQVNRQRLKRTRDLLGAVRVSVFAPDDLALVKSGPSLRRDYLDDALIALDPGVDRVVSNLERALKQRNALLRQSHGRLDEGAAMTLDVWDVKLAAAGEELTKRREDLVASLVPMLGEAYEVLAGKATPITATYQRSWNGLSLTDALEQGRDDDVRRGVTQRGPHRDELILDIDGLAARSEASQGEQRTLSLALRLSAHRLIGQRLGEPPLLLLDDVLSELDPDRSRALLTNLPPGQTVITSASPLPPAAQADHELVFDAEGHLRVGRS